MTITSILKEFNITPYNSQADSQKRKCYQLNPTTGEIIKKFNSIKEAGAAVSDAKSAGDQIGKVLTGKRKTAYGYRWSYADE